MLEMVPVVFITFILMAIDEGRGSYETDEEIERQYEDYLKWVEERR